MEFKKSKDSDLMKTERKFPNTCVYQYFRRMKFKILVSVLVRM